jgi:hypothetical protein
MVKLVKYFSTDAKTLTMAGQYGHHSLTLNMLQIFLKAGGDGNAPGEAFRFPLHTRQCGMEC